MPYYEYHCTNCGADFDVRATFQEKSAGLHPECPVCHSPEAEQVITAGMLVRGNADRAAASCCGPNTGTGCC